MQLYSRPVFALPDTEARDHEECPICFETKPVSALHDGLHCVCAECAARMEWCPLCRKELERNTRAPREPTLVVDRLPRVQMVDPNPWRAMAMEQERRLRELFPERWVIHLPLLAR